MLRSRSRPLATPEQAAPTSIVGQAVAARDTARQQVAALEATAAAATARLAELRAHVAAATLETDLAQLAAWEAGVRLCERLLAQAQAALPAARRTLHEAEETVAQRWTDYQACWRRCERAYLAHGAPIPAEVLAALRELVG
jgi:hypothetical protein